jgi:hypothetical protein
LLPDIRSFGFKELFIRAYMSAGISKKVGGDRFEVESAGIEPGKLNPLVVESMKAGLLAAVELVVPVLSN